MMQAVILAAGKGTRCEPLTLTRPKVLLRVANTTLLEHNLRQLQGIADQVIIVIGYRGEMVRKLLGMNFGKIKLTYVEQPEQKGSGDALMRCKPLLRERFLVLNGDDLYAREDIERCLRFPLCVMAQEVPDPEKWGILEVRKGLLTGFTEKPKKAASRLASTGLYLLDASIFQEKLKKSPRGEYEATDHLQALLKRGKQIRCEAVRGSWIPVGYPWHILEANAFLLRRITPQVKGTVERNAAVTGTLQLGAGSVVKGGTRIEGNVLIGKGCIIGPNAYLRGPVSIGDGCRIGNAVEIKNSVIFDNSSVPHLSYVGDSVIGGGVNLGAGTITANLRFDHGDIKMNINKERASSGQKKLGAIIGDGVQTGINVSIMPGVRIWPNACIAPHALVERDVVN